MRFRNGEEKKQPNFLEKEQRYYFSDIPEELENVLRFNGDILQISSTHDEVVFWTPNPYVSCRICGKPYMSACYVIPTNKFNDNWYYTKVIYSGAFSSCGCETFKWHYKEANLAHSPSGEPIKPEEPKMEDF